MSEKKIVHKKIEPFVEILQTKFSSAVTLTTFQFDMIKDEKQKRISTRKKIVLPPKNESSEQDNELLRIYELEAEALALELELEAKVEERFAYGEIERDIYLKVSDKLRDEKRCFEGELDNVSKKISNPDEVINYTVELCESMGFSWGKGGLYQKTALQNLIFPAGVQYDRKNDAYRTETAANIFRKIDSFPSDYEKNKGGKLDWKTNYSASVAGTRFELVTFGL